MDYDKKSAGWSRTQRTLASVLVTAIVTCQSASAQGSSQLPAEYYQDEDSMRPSAACQGLFPSPGGLGVPSTTVVPHEYVLLFVFDTYKHSEAAGQTIFHADPDPQHTLRKTVGCISDSDRTTDGNGNPIKGWGIEVKGGCPTDCTGPHLEELFRALAKKKRQGSRIPAPVADPLKDLGDGALHWGIFQAPLPDGETSEVRVWQVHVKDALHAGRILSSLNNLIGVQGYLGHLLIGHRPVVDCAPVASASDKCRRERAQP